MRALCLLALVCGQFCSSSKFCSVLCALCFLLCAVRSMLFALRSVRALRARSLSPTCRPNRSPRSAAKCLNHNCLSSFCCRERFPPFPAPWGQPLGRAQKWPEQIQRRLALTVLLSPLSGATVVGNNWAQIRLAVPVAAQLTWAAQFADSQSSPLCLRQFCGRQSVANWGRPARLGPNWLGRWSVVGATGEWDNF